MRSHKCKPAPAILFLPNLSYEHEQQVAQERGREGVKEGGLLDERGRVHTDRDRGMNRENWDWERQTREKEVEW